MPKVAIKQFGLFGRNYAISPDCTDCEDIIHGTVYEDQSGNKLCADCFEAADLVLCPNCADVTTRTDMIENPDGDEWCTDCALSDSFECESCNGRSWDTDCVTVEHNNGRYGRTETVHLCERCADRETTCCSDCDKRIYQQDAIGTAAGDEICQGCYEDSYITCEDCNEVVHNDNARFTDNGCYCSDCGSQDEGNFDPAGFRDRTGSMTEIGSTRCFGVELETDECGGYSDLSGSNAWGVKDDCTVAGKEFYSDILSGDDGLDAIREWGKVADRHGWDAGASSGYHLHLDMRGESDDSLYAVAYAYRRTENVWFSFVDGYRRRCSYSRPMTISCADINEAAADGRSFYSFSARGSRYFWCNLVAFSHHSTIEIRSYEGTCDDTEVINWVKAHTRFADWATGLGLAGVKKALDGMGCDDMFRLIMREVWQDYPLSDYYAEKARRHAHGYLTESISLEACTT